MVTETRAQRQHRRHARKRVLALLAAKAKYVGEIVGCPDCGNDEVVIPPEALEELRAQYGVGKPCATPSCDGRLERIKLADVTRELDQMRTEARNG